MLYKQHKAFNATNIQPVQIGQTNPPSPHETFVTQIIDTNYEAIFEKCDYNDQKLCDEGCNAFYHGEYAYCAKFLSNSYAINNDGQRYMISFPLYAGAKFALNPTDDGRAQFHQMLDGMVGDIQFASTNSSHRGRYGKGYATDAYYIKILHHDLVDIKTRFPNPSPDVTYIESLRLKILDLANNAPVQN